MPNINTIHFFRKQCIHLDSRFDFLKELVKHVPELSEENNDNNCTKPSTEKKEQIENSESDEET